MRQNERQTLNGGESGRIEWQHSASICVTCDSSFLVFPPERYAAECPACESVDLDDTLPALSTVTESEIDAALLPLEG